MDIVIENIEESIDLFGGLTLFHKIINPVVIFIIVVLFSRWKAKKNGWNESYKPAVLLNLAWAGLGITHFFIPTELFIILLLSVVIIGAISASIIYKIPFKDAMIFAILVSMIGLVIYFCTAWVFYQRNLAEEDFD